MLSKRNSLVHSWLNIEAAGQQSASLFVNAKKLPNDHRDGQFQVRPLVTDIANVHISSIPILDKFSGKNGHGEKLQRR